MYKFTYIHVELTNSSGQRHFLRHIVPIDKMLVLFESDHDFEHFVPRCRPDEAAYSGAKWLAPLERDNAEDEDLELCDEDLPDEWLAIEDDLDEYLDPDDEELDFLLDGDDVGVPTSVRPSQRGWLH